MGDNRIDTSAEDTGKLTPMMRQCLGYYRDNETNPVREIPREHRWTTRQLNTALDRNWLKVCPGGWHVLSDAGLAALSQNKDADHG